MSDNPEPNPNEPILEALAAKAERRAEQDRRIFGEPEPAPTPRANGCRPR